MKRFLIGHLARYGDCLYATTIARQIKADFPDSHLTWAIASQFKSILENNPHVDKVWEIVIADGDYYEKGWQKFMTVAEKRKSMGEFDEIIYSQIAPLNWINFTGTIRGTILKAYQRPITVSVAPVLRLSDLEIDRVKKFAESKFLSRYRQVILFECAPGSLQSKVTPEFAVEIANIITKEDHDICFILTSLNKLKITNPQIIDASELSFRENAELTKYCSLLIGCSSGITWLCTSDWARKIPTVQLLDSFFSIYSGMDYDFKINSLDRDHIIELTNYNVDSVVNILKYIGKEKFENLKVKFHQTYVPKVLHLKFILKLIISQHKQFREIKEFINNFTIVNSKYADPINVPWFSTWILIIYYKIKFAIIYLWKGKRNNHAIIN